MANTPKAATTLWALVNDAQKEVRIPALQRDYAHGRTGTGASAERAAIVRERFLKSIDHALAAGSQPLSLDFLFGPDNGKVFEPIDGQQRLTTLFLYHWYLIPEGIAREPLGRFRYETRASSREFVRLLADTAADTVRATVDQGSLSGGITDLSGFALRWRDDPTVSGMLVVLDAIHEKWKGCQAAERTAAWERLTSSEDPAVYFFMPDHNGGGTRQSAYELYIRMNDRGKQLTPFEQFKAWLEEYVDRRVESGTIKPQVGNWAATGADGTTQKNWTELLDTEWTDLFWQHMDEENDLVDEEFMRFFILFASTEYARSDDNYGDVKQRRAVLDELLREEILQTSLFEEKRCFTDRSLQLAFSTLQALSGGGNSRLSEQMRRCGIGPWPDGVKEHRTLLDTVITGEITLLDRLRFFAFAMVIAPRYTKIRERDETVAQEIVRAVRVIDNVARNTPELNRDEFLRLVPVLARLVEQLVPDQADARDLGVYSSLTRLSDDDISRIAGNPGRIAEQIREERRKARLIEGETAWEETLIAAEAGPFLRGRVDFLLGYVFGAEEDDDPRSKAQRDRFGRYAQIVNGLFRANGRTAFNTNLGDARGNPDAFLLRRALLTLGYFNYQLRTRSGGLTPRWSFCGDRENAERERDQWYKHGLAGSDDSAHGESLMRTLVAEVDSHLNGMEISKDTVTKALRQIVDGSLKDHPAPEDWRWWYIAYPELIAYAEVRQTWWSSDDRRAHVLKTSQHKGRHVELVSYALYRYLENNRSASGGMESGQSRGEKTAVAEWYAPFTEVDYYEASTTREVPCMYLDGYRPAGRAEGKEGGTTFYLDVAFRTAAASYQPTNKGRLGKYTLTFARRPDDSGQADIPKSIRTALEAAGFKAASTRSAYERTVPVSPETWASAVAEEIGKLSRLLPR